MLFIDRRHRLGHHYDRRYGIETTGMVSRDGLVGMPADIRAFAGDYVPTNIALFRRIVRKSRLDPREFTFVDLGSGKGRIALAATRYPFKAILGVEADANLHRTALDNLERWRGADHDPSVNFVHSDARTIELPKGNLFIFMYSPFRDQIFAQVGERLATAAREPGRAMVVAYSADWEADVLLRTRAYIRIRMLRRQFWKRPTVSFLYNQAAYDMRQSSIGQGLVSRLGRLGKPRSASTMNNPPANARVRNVVLARYLFAGCRSLFRPTHRPSS